LCWIERQGHRKGRVRCELKSTVAFRFMKQIYRSIFQQKNMPWLQAKSILHAIVSDWLLGRRCRISCICAEPIRKPLMAGLSCMIGGG
jgi:hypothetical protein